MPDEKYDFMSLDVSKLDESQRAEFVEQIKKKIQPESVKEVISIDASKLTEDQRAALSERLKAIARGVAFDRNLSETLVSAEPHHSSHTDDDGWI